MCLQRLYPGASIRADLDCLGSIGSKIHRPKGYLLRADNNMWLVKLNWYGLVFGNSSSGHGQNIAIQHDNAEPDLCTLLFLMCHARRACGWLFQESATLISALTHLPTWHDQSITHHVTHHDRQHTVPLDACSKSIKSNLKALGRSTLPATRYKKEDQGWLNLAEHAVQI